MDPNATLDALRALLDKTEPLTPEERDEANYLRGCLRGWLARGGFAPTTTDSEFGCDRCGVMTIDGEGSYLGDDRVCEYCYRHYTGQGGAA